MIHVPIRSPVSCVFSRSVTRLLLATGVLWAECSGGKRPYPRSGIRKFWIHFMCRTINRNSTMPPVDRITKDTQTPKPVQVRDSRTPMIIPVLAPPLRPVRPCYPLRDFIIAETIHDPKLIIYRTPVAGGRRMIPHCCYRRQPDHYYLRGLSRTRWDRTSVGSSLLRGTTLASRVRTAGSWRIV